MAKELKVVQPSGGGNGDVCTYLWACAICDENETCQKDKEGHSRWLVSKRLERIEYTVLVMSNKGGVGKSTVIAGCYVTDGRIVRNAGARVWRGGKIVETDRIESLRRFRDDVREVAQNYECGIGLEGYNDLVEGDIIECFTQQARSRIAG